MILVFQVFYVTFIYLMVEYRGINHYTNYKIHHKNFSTYDSNGRILVENLTITLDSNDVLSIQLNPISV